MVGKIITRKAAAAEKKEVQEKKIAMVVDDSSSSKASSSEKSTPPKPKKAVSKVIPKKVAEKNEGEKKEEKKEVPAPQKNKRERMEVDQGASKKSRKEKQPSEDVKVDEKQETPLLYVAVESESRLNITEIREFFASSGFDATIVKFVRFLRLRRKKKTGSKFRGIWVNFTTLEDTQKALALNGKEFKGKQLTVKIHEKSERAKQPKQAKQAKKAIPPIPESSKTVSVKGKTITSESDIRQFFQDFSGDIKEIKSFHSTTGQIEVSIVNFNTHDSVQKAVQLHNVNFNGKGVSVAYSL